MNGPTRKTRRGQPLVVLGLMMAGWIGARAVIIEAGRNDDDDASQVQMAGAENGLQGVMTASTHAPTVALRPMLISSAHAASRPAKNRVATPPREVWSEAALSQAQSKPPATAPMLAPVQPEVMAPLAPVAPPRRLSARVAAGHQMLYLAGLAQLNMPELATLDSDVPAKPPRARGAPLPRWSGDAWLFWRKGGNGFNLPGAGLPWVNLPSGAYGASQAGAVIRYRLAPSSGHRPALYLRGSTGLQRPRGEELAGGLMLRPLAGVPVSAMAELRVTRTLTGTVTRPAVALVSELAPIRLPLGFKAETYVAGGYVGGTGATPFVDGQLRLEQRLAKAGPFELSAGGGAWGGAQRGAQRLDLGPSASLTVPIGPVGSRLSADWRFRVAGNAAPNSGPALTLSAGF